MYKLIAILLVLIAGCAMHKPDAPAAGDRGPAGVSGTDGAKGDKGDQGSAGLDAVPPSAVKFCPNYATTYPTVFPEYGICIDNKLYGVYWDNHASWLAEVVPGYYASTSTSAPCNFTVLPSCVIQ